MKIVIEVEAVGAGLARLRSPDGRVLYVEARRGESGIRWFVHVDGHGRSAARSYPCPDPSLVLYRVTSELGVTRSEPAREEAARPAPPLAKPRPPARRGS